MVHYMLCHVLCRSFADARMQQLARSASSILHPQQQSQQASTSTPGSAASPDDRRQWRQSRLLSSQDEVAVSQAVTLATKQQESALQVRHRQPFATYGSCLHL